MRLVLAVALLAACGGGGSKAPPEQPALASEPEPAEPVSLTGAAECDALIARLQCELDHGEGDPGSLDELIRVYRDGLQHDGSRAATLDSCETVLDEERPDLEAKGCWRMGDAFDDRPVVAPQTCDRQPTWEPLDDPTCQTLITRTLCSYGKAGDAMPCYAVKAFMDSLDMWRDSLAEPSERQDTIDSCKQALDGAADAFTAQGC